MIFFCVFSFSGSVLGFVFCCLCLFLVFGTSLDVPILCHLNPREVALECILCLFCQVSGVGI